MHRSGGKMKGTVFLVFLWALQTVHGVPTSHRSECGRQIIHLRRGESFTLQCGSDCTSVIQPHVFTWWKLEDGGMKRMRLRFNGPVVTEEAASWETGGHYECKCGSDGPYCGYYVSVLPEVTFTSSHSASHYGDVIHLSCTVEGFPTNASSITNQYGIRVVEQNQLSMGSFKIETRATVKNVEEENYVCSVEVYYNGKKVAEEKRSLKIKLYSPPSILYTTEYVIHQASEFGQAGQLTCAVNTSPDTESHVTWRANGEAIQDGAKYSRSVSSSSEEVMLFYLHVADIQQSDIGSFLCQLSSDYNREDSQEAWIRVDYRKDYGGRSLDGKHYYTGGGSYENNGGYYGFRSATSLGVVAVLLFLSVLAGLGTWGVIAQRRRRKMVTMMMGKTRPTIDGEEGNCAVAANNSLVRVGSSPTVIKRK